MPAEGLPHNLSSKLVGYLVVAVCVLAVPLGTYTLDVRDFASPAFVHTEQLVTAESVRIDRESGIVTAVLETGSRVLLHANTSLFLNDECIQCEPDAAPRLMALNEKFVIMDTVTGSKAMVMNRTYRSFLDWTMQSWELPAVSLGLMSGLLLGTSAGLAFAMRTPVTIAVGLFVAILTMTRGASQKAVNMYTTLIGACLAALCMVHPRGEPAQKVLVPLALAIGVHFIQTFAFAETGGVMTFTPWMLIAPILLGVGCALATWKLNTIPSYGRVEQGWRTCTQYNQASSRDTLHCPENRFKRKGKGQQAQVQQDQMQELPPQDYEEAY